MIILSLNSGSSSVKFLVFDYANSKTLATGVVERIKIGGSFIELSSSKKDVKIPFECADHKEAVKMILDTIQDKDLGVLQNINEISAVGHRVVHGGERFTKSVIIDDDVIATLKDLYNLAPLHNPPNVLGIEAAKEVLPNVPHMAILDTAWHQTMPQHTYLYATPYEWYKKYGIRRYGFHGTSFLYVAKRAAVLLSKKPEDCNLVCMHIGNGASANAIKDGCSYDTSMGMTPLEGLIMGTRAGDHDAALDLFVMDRESKSTKDMNDILNKKSGILGITEKFVDRRDVENAAAEGDKRAQLAIDMECYRLKKYIGAYMAAVGGADAIVFTAGVGEKSPIIREKALENLEFMGIVLDKEKNKQAKTRNAEMLISAENSKVKVFVIPTDEERVFIEDVVALLKGTYSEHTTFKYDFADKSYVNTSREESLKKELEKKPGLAKIIAKP